MVEEALQRHLIYLAAFIAHLAFFGTTLLNPGIASNKNQPSPHEIQFNKRLYCKKCKLVRNGWTRHCHTCDVCITHIDHHCPVTGKCIGRNNICCFFFLIIWGYISLIYSGYILYLGAMDTFGEDKSE